MKKIILFKFVLLTSLFLISNCALLKQIQNTTNGRSSNFEKIVLGMSHEDMLKATQHKVLDSFQISKVKTLYKFEEGFTVVENNIVKEAYLFRTIQPEDTIQDLVSLGMDAVGILRGAGWPLSIKQNGGAHVFYYRTGTLLLKDLELVNSFNRFEDYSVSISAYKGIELKNPIYYIVPSVAGVERNSLEFIEVRNYVEHILALSNGKVTNKLLEANSILFVNFGVGNKEVDILTYSTPVYRSVYNPGTTSTTQVRNFYGQSLGSTETTTPGSYSTQYAGQDMRTVKVENFRRHLIMEAIHASAFKNDGEKKYFWKVSAVSNGNTGDFRAILPVLAYGANGYIYKNTGKEVGIKIDFDQMMTFFLEIFSK